MERTNGQFPIHVCGIVTAVSSVRDRVFCRQVQCVYCGETRWKMEMEEQLDEGICCLDSQHMPRYNELQSSRYP